VDYTVKDLCQGMAPVVRGWLAMIERLSSLHQRLPSVQMEQSDFREIIDRYDSLSPCFMQIRPTSRILGSVAATLTR
jgi:hypothetical protein